MPPSLERHTHTYLHTYLYQIPQIFSSFFPLSLSTPSLSPIPLFLRAFLSLSYSLFLHSCPSVSLFLSPPQLPLSLLDLCHLFSPIYIQDLPSSLLQHYLSSLFPITSSNYILSLYLQVSMQFPNPPSSHHFHAIYIRCNIFPISNVIS